MGIGLDLSLPDFDIKSIDAKVMGTRLAGILGYLMENYHQVVYDRKICQILREQNEERDHEIILLFTVWPSQNTANVKKADLICHFANGVSESQTTNELFSMISHYIQAREQLQ